MRYLLLFCLGIFACTTTQDTVNSEREASEGTEILVQNPIDLRDLLIRLPGVNVTGDRVLLRGRPPLFVVDRVPIGKNYAAVSRTVLPNDVARVEALTNPVDTNRYGRPGANGVILITTKGNE